MTRQQLKQHWLKYLYITLQPALIWERYGPWAFCLNLGLIINYRKFPVTDSLNIATICTYIHIHTTYYFFYTKCYKTYCWNVVLIATHICDFCVYIYITKFVMFLIKFIVNIYIIYLIYLLVYLLFNGYKNSLTSFFIITIRNGC